MIDVSEIDAGAVALDLGVEWRLAIDEDDGKAELVGEIGDRRLDVLDEQPGLCG